MDGGLISNNPTLDLLTEISYFNAALDATFRSKEKVTPAVVLSLGTGAPPPTDITIIDVYRPDSIVGIAKMAFIASSLGQLLVDQVRLTFFRANISKKLTKIMVTAGLAIGRPSGGASSRLVQHVSHPLLPVQSADE